MGIGLAQNEFGFDGTHPIDKEAHGRGLAQVLQGRQTAGIGHLQRRYLIEVLPREAQRGTTRGHHPQRGTHPEERGDQRCRGEHVLKVVEDQEETLAGKVCREGAGQGLLGAFADAQPLRDRGRDEARITQWRERNENHAIGIHRRDPLRDGEREASLPSAPRSCQGEEPDRGLSQKARYRRDRLFPTDEGGEGNRQTGMAIAPFPTRACRRRMPGRGY